MRNISNQQIIRVYRSIVRKANTELKFTNFEFFRTKLNTAFKQPCDDSVEKERKYQDALYLLNNNLGGTI
ncbi:hypothetical protein DLAC_01848 [Tieghemostelium lacteum]|uniref:LYR motif-containing protein 4 n=1 Tax=Tieghemostelium lacteum TaxID=361077 RepID=A0A152A6T2_TIELA|nr:hypothetical protein DLAC_01848 [Tieghemostelium lacteum]|eukprot:KYR01831.1 hypothetical protein DLAC_01848 [Tieghemostelium lacteum]